MTRREWWIFWAGTSVAGAVFGAMFHSLLLTVYNLVLLAVDIYFANKEEK